MKLQFEYDDTEFKKEIRSMIEAEFKTIIKETVTEMTKTLIASMVTHLPTRVNTIMEVEIHDRVTKMAGNEFREIAKTVIVEKITDDLMKEMITRHLEKNGLHFRV